MDAILGLLFEIVLAFVGWIYHALLALFGFSPDWESTRSEALRQRPVLAALICFGIAVVFFTIVGWLVWLVYR
jgi:hypothetical protein